MADMGEDAPVAVAFPNPAGVLRRAAQGRCRWDARVAHPECRRRPAEDISKRIEHIESTRAGVPHQVARGRCPGDARVARQSDASAEDLASTLERETDSIYLSRPLSPPPLTPLSVSHLPICAARAAEWDAAGQC